jgi:hypothetical protein
MTAVPALVQSASLQDDASLSTISVTLPNPVRAGNLIHVTNNWVVPSGDENPLGMADTIGNSYQRTLHAFNPGSVVTEHWFAREAVAGSCTVTLTFVAARTFKRMIVAEFSGCDGPYDTSAATPNFAAVEGTDGFVTPSVTPSVSGCLLVATAVDVSAAFTTVVAGTGYTMIAVTQPTGDVATEYRVQPVAAATQGTFTITDAARGDASQSLITVYRPQLSLRSDAPFVPAGRGATW